jgi:DNA repair ATPase RecN
MDDTSPLYVRMKQALSWIKHNKNILNKDIAERMGLTNVSFSRGMERIRHKPDDEFIIKFHQATDEVFSLNWLLYGEGEKFATNAQEPQLAPPSSVDFSSYINALLAKTDETIASLNREIASLHERLKEKDERLREKDERIAELSSLAEERLHRIAELNRIIDYSNASLSDYPFPLGAADKGKSKRKTT